MSRGQTTLDFAFGVGLFILVVAFVFAFVPSMLDPFSGTGQSERVIADRLASQLSEGMLVTTPAHPYILDTTCTNAFFDDTSPSQCRFDGATLHERLGLSERYQVQVTLTQNGKSRNIGLNPPKGSDSVAAARRVVIVDGNEATLTVEVW